MSYADDAQATDPGVSSSDEDEATEVSERGGGPSLGMGTDDSGSSQQFSGFDSLNDNRGFDADSFEVASQTYGGMGLGTNLSQAQFNAATGRTNYNPHPNSFFSQLFGPENVDYTNIYGSQEGIAQLNTMALDRYNNPINAKGEVRGSVGDPTAFGNIMSTDRKQGVGEMVTRGLASLTPIGFPLSMLGKTQKSIAPISGIQVPGAEVGKGFNYDPSLDPSSPSYTGSQGIVSGIINTLTGGAGTQAYDAAKSAIEDALGSKEKEKEREEKGSGQFNTQNNMNMMNKINETLRNINTNPINVIPKVEINKLRPTFGS